MLNISPLATKRINYVGIISKHLISCFLLLQFSNFALNDSDHDSCTGEVQTTWLKSVEENGNCVTKIRVYNTFLEEEKL